LRPDTAGREPSRAPESPAPQDTTWWDARVAGSARRPLRGGLA